MSTHLITESGHVRNQRTGFCFEVEQKSMLLRAQRQQVGGMLGRSACSRGSDLRAR